MDTSISTEPFEIPRSSGVQLHITSLPSGRLGRGAYEFVDWLNAAGQSWWQVLPLGPPDRWRSPYKSRSAFACWPELLERPDAPVSSEQDADFRDRQAFWIGDWERANSVRRAVHDQVRFEREWLALRGYAAERGVRLIGDMPLYVAPGSVDHRNHPALFETGMVAGAPPDVYTVRGQRWGNPVYRWPAMRSRGYRWWIERLSRANELFDAVRLDHFRGLVAYWAIPEGASDARAGRWRRGPLDAPLLAARRSLGSLPLIAEDLGVITPPVERLRKRLGIPGMAVLQFVYESDGEHGEDPLLKAASGRVLYTGTHDQDTLVGWWDSLNADGRAPLLGALNARSIEHDARDPAWGLIALALSAPAPLVMTQLQDLLGLPSSARMNTPGRASGNWSWRMAPGPLPQRLARRLRDATEQAGRLT